MAKAQIPSIKQPNLFPVESSSRLNLFAGVNPAPGDVDTGEGTFGHGPPRYGPWGPLMGPVLSFPPSIVMGPPPGTHYQLAGFLVSPGPVGTSWGHFGTWDRPPFKRQSVNYHDYGAGRNFKASGGGHVPSYGGGPLQTMGKYLPPGGSYMPPGGVVTGGAGGTFTEYGQQGMFGPAPNTVPVGPNPISGLPVTSDSASFYELGVRGSSEAKLNQGFSPAFLGKKEMGKTISAVGGSSLPVPGVSEASGAQLDKEVSFGFNQQGGINKGDAIFDGGSGDTGFGLTGLKKGPITKDSIGHIQSSSGASFKQLSGKFSVGKGIITEDTVGSTIGDTSFQTSSDAGMSHRGIERGVISKDNLRKTDATLGAGVIGVSVDSFKDSDKGFNKEYITKRKIDKGDGVIDTGSVSVFSGESGLSKTEINQGASVGQSDTLRVETGEKIDTVAGHVHGSSIAGSSSMDIDRGQRVASMRLGDNLEQTGVATDGGSFLLGDSRGSLDQGVSTDLAVVGTSLDAGRPVSYEETDTSRSGLTKVEHGANFEFSKQDNFGNVGALVETDSFPKVDTLGSRQVERAVIFASSGPTNFVNEGGSSKIRLSKTHLIREAPAEYGPESNIDGSSSIQVDRGVNFESMNGDKFGQAGTAIDSGSIVQGDSRASVDLGVNRDLTQRQNLRVGGTLFDAGLSVSYEGTDTSGSVLTKVDRGANFETSKQDSFGSVGDLVDTVDTSGVDQVKRTFIAASGGRADIVKDGFGKIGLSKTEIIRGTPVDYVEKHTLGVEAGTKISTEDAGHFHESNIGGSASTKVDRGVKFVSTSGDKFGDLTLTSAESLQSKITRTRIDQGEYTDLSRDANHKMVFGMAGVEGAASLQNRQAKTKIDHGVTDDFGQDVSHTVNFRTGTGITSPRSLHESNIGGSSHSKADRVVYTGSSRQENAGQAEPALDSGIFVLGDSRASVDQGVSRGFRHQNLGTSRDAHRRVSFEERDTGGLMLTKVDHGVSLESSRKAGALVNTGSFPTVHTGESSQMERSLIAASSGRTNVGKGDSMVDFGSSLAPFGVRMASKDGSDDHKAAIAGNTAGDLLPFGGKAKFRAKIVEKSKISLTVSDNAGLGSTTGASVNIPGINKKVCLDIGLKKESFINWAGTQIVKTVFAARPRTLKDITDVIACARVSGLKVRPVGSKHSWAPLFADEGQIAVYMDQLQSEYPNGQGIYITKDDPKSRKVEVSVMAGVTVADLKTFQLANKVELPCNTVATQMQVVSVVATGSHGHGFNCMNPGDYVVEMRIVDSSGELKTYSVDRDLDMMRAVQANYGLFGIIYDITFTMDYQTVVETRNDYYKAGDLFYNPVELRRLVESFDSVNLFWFPFNSLDTSNTSSFTNHDFKQDGIWARLGRTVDGTGKALLPESYYVRRDVQDKMTATMLEQAAPLIVRMPLSTPTFLNSGFKQIKRQYPAGRPILQERTNAIHFRGHVDTVQVLNMEFAFNYKGDFALLTKIIQVAIDALKAYSRLGQFPFYIMEMRWMGYSDSYMTPASIADHKHGHTFFIEVISLKGTRGWRDFCTDVADEWFRLGGVPHLAKQWSFLPNVEERIRKGYGANMRRFMVQLEKSCADPCMMFFNDALKKIFYSHRNALQEKRLTTTKGININFAILLSVSQKLQNTVETNLTRYWCSKEFSVKPQEEVTIDK